MPAKDQQIMMIDNMVDYYSVNSTPRNHYNDHHSVIQLINEPVAMASFSLSQLVRPSVDQL